jgi:inosine/xanthosine triphosphate pyrophosphatase family protein
MSSLIQILLATNNSSKVKRYQFLEQKLPIKLLSLKDLGVELKVDENGATELENAKIKATAGYNTSKIPSIGLDSGFYIQGLDAEQQPGKEVKRKAGVLENDSIETSYHKMLQFYINLANQLGGQAEAYFLDTFYLFDGQKYFEAEAKRQVVLTNSPFGQDFHFPLCSLYKVNGIYYHQLNKEQMEEFLKPSNEALRGIVRRFLDAEVFRQK